jgi:Na+-translocating ferredoxin:NAD+ oxidoreductase RnfC subunit
MTIEDIRKNGIVGAGGAGFPTHIKLQSRPEYLILNAAECEPLLHKDQQILLNYSDEVLTGFQTAMELTGATHGIIAIKEKHHQLINLLKDRMQSARFAGKIKLELIGDFYPAGDEVTLIYLTTGRIVQPGALPISVGCLVQNVETIFNIALNKPVVEKFLTIAGAVEKPLTIKAPLGVSYQDLLNQFSITCRAFVLRSGGLMMGILEKDLNQVVTKCTNGLIVLPSDHHCVTMYQRYSTPEQTIRIAKAACDQCTFCTDLCPRYLLGHPVRPETAMRNRMFSSGDEILTHLGNAFCCECNLCTLFSCPESLDPKGATIIEKRQLQSQQFQWQGLPVKVHPMLNYRKVPTKKLKQRLDILKFKDEASLTEITLNPKQVRLPLRQHSGVPAKPIVTSGQRVEKYDLIAEADGKISAHIHASITGKIVAVTDESITIERES